ncbi:Right handed beta helix domain-containing protein OS=Streptomyces griseomycini OX=66895 GN=FHS37_003731 PE=4 SV=1 [Streptomyces griseomycini]
MHRVEPGKSIQRAVDAAEPGDTVLLAPGTHEGSADITTSNLTLREDGAHRTVRRRAWTPARAPAPRRGMGHLRYRYHKKPVERVTVHSLALRGFEKSGLWASRTDRLTVRR